MANHEEKIAARKFYESLLQQLAQGSIDMHDLLGKHNIGYLEIGNLQDCGTFEYIKLKRIRQGTVPQSVSNSFQRHLWYSQHSLSDLGVVQFSVEGRDIFAIYIVGYVDDGWDNGCTLMEIYSAEGELLGATTDRVNWRETELDQNDYYNTTPDYNLRASITYPPIWSEAEVLEV